MKKTLTCLMVIFSANAFAEVLQCPQTLTVTESVFAQMGWSSYKMTSAKTLDRATLYEGALGDTQAALAPEETEDKDQLTQTWSLDSENKSYWMQCQYHNSGAVIMRKIPESITECKNVLLLDEHHNAANSGTIKCE